ncbi:hypothetical protein CRG98_009024 [Punica granatum]|uniref:Disease resistance protein RGA3 n=1 Tax=Punica granatum TaxID=22663 RepID=A0A2I0KQ04_PUNGR|nr:hypothetical protein CRG98_009024 [Punica granatum]
MAEAVLGGVVESVTGHLISLISQEIGLACGVKAELEKLQTTVFIIGGVLREADKRRVEAEDWKAWLKKLEELFYDADDLFDDYSTEALRRRRRTGGGKRILNQVSIFFSSSNQILYAIKMAHRVKEIRKRIYEISDDRVRFLLDGNSNPIGSSVENPARPETYPSECELHVIGRDKDKKEVIKFLLNRNFEENVSVLPIVGVGGLGKTTLARLVFNDESVKEYFEMKLWVCVSFNFNVEDILTKTVRECNPNNEGIANLQGNELRRKLGEELNGKKFLLVLDDVWNDNRSEWLKLQGYLMNGAKGSKILVTTRHTVVAETMTREFHELSGLPEDEALSLLMRMAMKEEHEWRNKNLEKIAREIVKKCAGVPLAIRTIGRLLVNSRCTEGDWLNFKDNDLSSINQEDGDITPTLKLSYDFLPLHLKPCFAYCSLFPQDYALEPRLNELSRLTGLRKELTIVNLERVGSSSNSSEVDASFSMEKLADLQCLELCCGDFQCLFWSNNRDANASSEEEVLEKLRPHPYLKGLSIKAYGGARLPSWVSQLHKLVEIDISHCEACRQLPPVDQLPSLERICLWNLKNLEHIELSEGGRMPQSNFFPSLEEINLYDLPKFKGWEWERKGNRIEEEDGDSSSSSSLLMLHWFSDKVKVRIDDCPRFSYMSHGQQRLQLGGWRMRNVTALLLHQRDPLLLPLGPQRPMPVLVPTDPSPSTDSLSLTALTSLSISEIEDAEQLPVELFQSLPSLQYLGIGNCPRLKALPLGLIQSLPSLQDQLLRESEGFA